MTFRIFKFSALFLVFLAISGFAPGIRGKEYRPAEFKFISPADFAEDEGITKYIFAADELAAVGAWERAVDNYQKALDALLDEFPEMLYPAERMHEEGLEHFAPAIEYCRKKMLKMDARTQARYRATYEKQASRALTRAVTKIDIKGLLEVSRRYPFTGSGLKAQTILAGIALEKMDFQTASGCYDKVLDARKAWPPKEADITQSYAATIAGAARSYRMWGAREKLLGLDSLLDADSALGSKTILVAGKPVSLAEFVNDEIKSLETHRPPNRHVSDYPILGGNSSRNALPSAHASKTGCIQWRYYITNDNKVFNFDGMFLDSITRRSFLVSGIPISAQGRLYFNTGNALLALDEVTGRLKFTFRPPTRPRMRNSQMPPPMEMCSVYDGIVYAAIPARRGEKYNSPLYRTLFAVDAKTGKLIWDSASDTGTGVNEYVSGDAVKYGDEILFVVLKDRSGQMGCFLVSADAKTGKENRRLHFANRSGALPGAKEPHPTDAIAIEGDTAIITSTAGSITAIDLINNKVNWAVKYHQKYVAGKFYKGKYDRPKIWCSNYPLVHEGRVIVAPKESDNLYCLDVETGELLWQEEMPKLIFLVGIFEGKLYLIDGSRLKAIDIGNGKKFDVCKGSLDKAVIGRPAITGSAIYVSTLQSLFRFELKTGELEKVLGWRKNKMFPSNLLYTGNGLIAANSEHIVLFEDSGLLDILSGELKKEPDNPILLYRRGRMLLARKQYRRALGDLLEAEKKATDEHIFSGYPLPVVIRNGLYECHLALAHLPAEDDFEEGLKNARAALKYANTDEKKAPALATIGDILGKGKDKKSINEALATLQKLIEIYPEAMIPLGNGAEQSAFRCGTKRINDIFLKYPSASLGEMSGRAEKLLETVQQRPSRAGYIGVFKKYPNSPAARKALLKIAGQYEKDGLSSMAFVALKNPAFNNMKPGAESVRVKLLLQDIAWSLANYDEARSALQELAKCPEETSVEYDGRKIHVRGFAVKRLMELDELLASIEGSEKFDKDAKLAHKINLGVKAQHDIPKFLRAEGRRPVFLNDKILTTCKGLIRCWDTRTGKVLWENHTPRAWLGFRMGFSGKKSVREVFEGHGAQKAGIKKGYIIEKINGVKIEKSVDYYRALSETKAGDRVKVIAYTGTQSIEKEITATPLPREYKMAIGYSWFNGDGNLVVRISHFKTEFRCIDIKSGDTMWTREYSSNLSRHDAHTVSNDLYVFTVNSDSGMQIELLDINTGKTAARLPLELQYVRRLGVVGRYCYYINANKNVCYVRDILTGLLEYRFRFRSVRSAASAGEGLLALTDHATMVRVIDLETGNLVGRLSANTSNGPVGKKPFSIKKSGGAVLVMEKTSSRVVIFESQNPKKPRSFDNQTKPIICAVNNNIVLLSDKYCAGKSKISIRAFDRKSGKLLWEKPIKPGDTGKSEYSIGFFHLTSDSIVLCAKQITPSYSSNSGTIVRRVVIKVLNMENGEEVRSYEFSSTPSDRIGAVIANGALCILEGGEVHIYR